MTLTALLDSGRYRAELQRLGPVLAHLELWREADRRARRITDRLVPPRDFFRGFGFESGGHNFVSRSRARSHHSAQRMIVLQYARDQILAKLERRVRMAEAVREYLR